jgi:hypothetical protein
MFFHSPFLYIHRKNILRHILEKKKRL